MTDEALRELLEWLGAAVLNTAPGETIEITHSDAAGIVAILSALPAGRKGRPRQWAYADQIGAVLDMLRGTPLKTVAREIAGETGQSQASAERRLRDLKASPRYTNWTSE